jgi:hypothetical protein
LNLDRLGTGPVPTGSVNPDLHPIERAPRRKHDTYGLTKLCHLEHAFGSGADLFFEKEKGTAGYLLVGGWFILREKHADWWLISQATRVSLCRKGP